MIKINNGFVKKGLFRDEKVLLLKNKPIVQNSFQYYNHHITRKNKGVKISY